MRVQAPEKAFDVKLHERGRLENLMGRCRVGFMAVFIARCSARGGEVRSFGGLTGGLPTRRYKQRRRRKEVGLANIRRT